MNSPDPTWLRPVEPGDVLDALDLALSGGPPIAPLPVADVERAQTVAMLQLDRPISEPGVGAVVATSGSTGRPKGVLLSRDAIVTSAEATHARLGGPGDWILALPTHYVAGLMVLARSVVGGTTAQRCRGDLADLPAAVARTRGRRYLSVVPTQLSRALADQATSAALARLDAVLVGGGPTPVELLELASAAGVRVVTTYGMSETCGGCVYDGVPLDPVRVRCEVGERILVSGPTLFSGYRGRPDLTAESLRADNELGRVFRTQDRGRLVDGRLVLLGRVDDVVISGGINVDLAEVERAARSWSAGRGETVILGVPDPDWGTAIIAVTDGDGDEQDLLAALSNCLPSYALPRRLVRLPALPRTAGGKIDRASLRALVSDRTSRR